MYRILITVVLMSAFIQSAHAVSIKSLPNLTQVVINEQTGGISTYAYAPEAPELLNKLSDPLSSSNNDFTGTSIEYYDVFYSNSDGSFNSNGEFLTITADFDNPNDSALNINRVFLVFNDRPAEFSSEVTSFVSNGIYVPLSELNAIGNNLGTTTLLGDTFNQPFRLSLTLGFDATDVSAIPVPAAVWLFGTALAGLLGFGKRRKTV